MAAGILSPVHIAFLLVVLLMLFGAKRLPEMGKSFGTGLRGFKDSLEPVARSAGGLLARAGKSGGAGRKRALCTGTPK